MDISVIVPIYKGKEYINSIIKQVEECKKQLINESVELILLNDYPDDYIEEQQSDCISIRVFNTDRNLGIQATRVKGYENSNGNYILFLDQDDKIAPLYLKSQLENIIKSKAASTVCKVKENGREKYNAVYPFENIVNKKHMFTVENAIISPGQVLLRKRDISNVWVNNILKHNGADDWLLWLCMLSENKKFVLNDNVLFEHILYGGNASWNSKQMILSEKEMYNIIKKTEKCDENYLEGLKSLVESEEMRYISLLEKYRDMFFMYDKWIALENEKGCLSTFLINKGYMKIAVYGIGIVGRQIISTLKNSEINVLAAIDRNANYIESNIPVTTIENFKTKVDLIIVSVVNISNAELKQIESTTGIKTVTFMQLLERWENDSTIRK